MNKEFVPYEIALELEKIGFDEPFITFDTQYLYRNGDFCRSNSGAITMFKSFNDELVIAPLYQQAFRWFRQKGFRFSIVDDHSNRETPYSFTTKHEYYYDTGSGNDWHKTYEKAELECLIKLIEIAKLK